MDSETWVRPSKCANSIDCVEVAVTTEGTKMRDAKDPEGPVLSFTTAEWEAFLVGAKAGEFDL